MRAHADDEPIYLQESIANIPLGPSSRIFRLTHARICREVEDTELAPGQIMIMYGDTQKHYVHQVLKRDRPRIGLSFEKGKADFLFESSTRIYF